MISEIILTNLGLSPNEAKIYLATLESGQTSAQRIAQKAQIKRTTTYSVLEGLVKKDFILKTNKEGHHHEGLDPHVWLSPLNLKIMAAEMARAMIASDPANKATYEKNLSETTRILDQVHQKIEQKLAPYQGASFYVFHPAFGYFAHTYHLQQQAIETGGKSPTPRQLSSLITQAKASKARVIFVQPQFDPRSAQAIANAIHGEVVPLDPLAEDVAANLEIMATKIQAAFTAQ